MTIFVYPSTSDNIGAEKLKNNFFCSKYSRTFFDRYGRERSKVNASFFDSALSHTRRSDASEKRKENSVSTFGHFRLSTSLESSPVSVKLFYNNWQCLGIIFELAELNINPT